MRLIDADVYKEEMKKRQNACGEWRDEAKERGDMETYYRADGALAVFCEAKLTLDKVPTIDVAPVVHGHWAVEGGRICCSVCGEQSLEYDYCPYCGAKMDEEEGNG